MKNLFSFTVGGVCLLVVTLANFDCPVAFGSESGPQVSVSGYSYDAAHSQVFTAAPDPAIWKVLDGVVTSGFRSGDTDALASNVVSSGSYLTLKGLFPGYGTLPPGVGHSGASFRALNPLGYGYYEILAEVTTSESAPSGWNFVMSLAPGATVVNYSTGGNPSGLKYGFVQTYSSISAATIPATANSGYKYGVDQGRGGDRSAHGFPGSVNFANQSPRSSPAAFNYYAVDWSPGGLVWYFNGKEVGRSTAPGPDQLVGANQLKVSIALLAGGNGGASATAYIKHFKFWRRNYGPRTSSPDGGYPLVSPRPVTGGAHWTSSPVALSDTGAASTVLSDYYPGDSIAWTSPAAADGTAYELYAWNPSVFSTALIEPDLATTASFPVDYGVDDTSSRAKSWPIDQSVDGQGWFGLGAWTFHPADSAAVTLATPAVITPENAGMDTRAGRVLFRPLGYLYDPFTGAGDLAANWSVLGGTWATGSGALAETGAGESLCVRALTATNWPTSRQHFVRADFTTGTADRANLGVIACFQDRGNYYLMRVRVDPTASPAAQYLELLKKQAGTYTTLESVVLPSTVGVLINTKFELLMEVNDSGAGGAELAGFINGREYLRSIDPRPLPPGKMGFRTWKTRAQLTRAGAGR